MRVYLYTMQTSKIQFSTEELQLAENAEIILTKNRIVKKTISLFGSLADEYRSIGARHAANLPAEVLELSPKIARGEQYQGLPYVVLDYPRLFSKADVFAIRSFFWWGNYFSLTLHLKGVYKEMFAGRINQQMNMLADNNFWISVSDDEWAHEVQERHYVAVKNMETGKFREAINTGIFLKLVVKWPLQQCNSIHTLFKEQFSIVLNLISG